MKKFFVLGVLFLLPITVYIFFASGVNNFAKLPVLTERVASVASFKTLEGTPITLKNRITVLGFFGEDVLSQQANAFNLAHKIYKKNHEFEDFQFVILLPEGTQNAALQLKNKLAEIENPEHWKFAFGSTSEIKKIFDSLESNLVLDGNFASPYVFIIDREGSLRGRDDDKDIGVLYGFDARDYSEINNKMSDDIKVILAEYRLALKKYNKGNRDI